MHHKPTWMGSLHCLGCIGSKFSHVKYLQMKLARFSLSVSALPTPTLNSIRPLVDYCAYRIVETCNKKTDYGSLIQS